MAKAKASAWAGVVGFLSGKKTYFIGALMIALGLLQGDNQMVLEGLGLITLRLGVAKS